MTIDSNYNLPSSDEPDFDNDESTSEIDDGITELELSINPELDKTAKQKNTRNHFAMRRIEQLKEERELRKLNEGYFDDWD